MSNNSRTDDLDERSILIEELLGAFQNKEWAEVIAKAKFLHSSELDSSLLANIVDAALYTFNQDAIKLAASFCVRPTLDHDTRVNLALRFSRANFPSEAFMVLMSCLDYKNFAVVGERNFVNIFERALASIEQCVDVFNPAVRVAHQARKQFRESKALQLPTSRPFEANKPLPSRLGFAKAIAESQATLKGKPTELVFQKDAPLWQRTMLVEGIERSEREILNAPVPRPFERADVYVNRWGDIWDTNGTIIRKVSNAPQIAQPENCREVDELIYCCGKEINTNLYHYFIECFPFLAWRLDNASSSIPVGIADYARPWVADSLRLASAGNVSIVSVGDAVFVRRLTLLRNNKFLLARSIAYQDSFARLIENCLGQEKHYETAPIYISRRDTRRRPLANELELESALQSIGIESVILTGLSLEEKIRKTYHSSFIVGGHGAGLSLLAFSKPQRMVFEILPARLPLHKIHLCMTQISRMVGHNHYLYLENGIVDFAAMRWSVDVQDVVTKIRQLLT